AVGVVLREDEADAVRIEQMEARRRLCERAPGRRVRRACTPFAVGSIRDLRGLPVAILRSPDHPLIEVAEFLRDALETHAAASSSSASKASCTVSFAASLPIRSQAIQMKACQALASSSSRASSRTR